MTRTGSVLPADLPTLTSEGYGIRETTRTIDAHLEVDTTDMMTTESVDPTVMILGTIDLPLETGTNGVTTTETADLPSNEIIESLL
jgi:hypothetical protein